MICTAGPPACGFGFVPERLVEPTNLLQDSNHLLQYLSGAGWLFPCRAASLQNGVRVCVCVCMYVCVPVEADYGC